MNKSMMAAACGLAIAGSAMAGTVDFTHVRDGSEPNHLELLNNNSLLLSSYGGNFASVSTAPSFDEGGMLGTSVDVVLTNFADWAVNGGDLWTFSRVKDRNGTSPLDLQQVQPGGNAGTAQDTVWRDGTVDVRVTAKIAGDNHTFGWYDGDTSNSFNTITDTVVGNTQTVSLSSQFVWGLNTDQNNGTSLALTSDATLDNVGQDQMVTYFIARNGQFYGWLLAWEDRRDGDFDYNDAWLEVTIVIPSPLAGGMAGVGLMGLAARRRRA
jgi:hypothetical protein